jgi:group II intron reverse transcriptase/maturase
MLTEEYLHECWGKLNKQAVAGIDRVTCQQFAENLDENIRELVEDLKHKRYQAIPIRRRYIPKSNGKQRPLGIPAVRDKLVQSAVAGILQAIWEADFYPCSYGYRPGRGAHDAINELQSTLWLGRFEYVVEADITGFFDNLDHEWLVKMLEHRIDDDAFIRLIRKWLKVGVLETDGQIVHPATGTPQGGVVSPVLANIYMHYVLNDWFEKVVRKTCRGACCLSVYADDFVTAFENEADARWFYAALPERLGKFGLRLSEEKTNIILFSRQRKQESGTFDFLGFEFRWVTSRRGKDWLKRSTSKKRLVQSIRNVKEWCKENRHLRLDEFFARLNARLRGYYNYFGVIGNLDRLTSFQHFVVIIVYRWLNRRSQRKSYNIAAFNAILEQFNLEKPRVTDRTTDAVFSMG